VPAEFEARPAAPAAAARRSTQVGLELVAGE
jgi:hypothetical protein